MHFNLQLYLLNNSLTQPKWLQNPLYSKGKKRRFTEGPLESSLMEGPLESPQNQPTPPGEAASLSGLSIVDYESSDDEDNDREDDLWKDVMPPW